MSLVDYEKLENIKFKLNLMKSTLIKTPIIDEKEFANIVTD